MCTDMAFQLTGNIKIRQHAFVVLQLTAQTHQIR